MINNYEILLTLLRVVLAGHHDLDLLARHHKIKSQTFQTEFLTYTCQTECGHPHRCLLVKGHVLETMTIIHVAEGEDETTLDDHLTDHGHETMMTVTMTVQVGHVPRLLERDPDLVMMINDLRDPDLETTNTLIGVQYILMV